MWTVLSCVLFAIVGAVIAVGKYGGRRPGPILSGMVIGAIFGFMPLQVLQAYLARQASQPSYFSSIALYFEAMREGDLVIWACTVAFLLLVGIIVVAWIKTAREFKREEQRKRRRGGNER